MGEKDMYATKRLRGLLALWLVLILVFGLGTTAYAAETYVIDVAAGNGPFLSDGTTPYSGNLYPGDTIKSTASNSGCFVVYYSDRDSYDGTGANVSVVDDNNITHSNYGYDYGNSHGVLSYNNAGSTAYRFSFGNTSWKTTVNQPVYRLTLTEIGAPPPSPDPEPSRPLVRCDVPVLFDPVKPVDKYGDVGGSITMSVSAQGALSFQWQVRYPGSADWQDIEGANSDTYTLMGLDAMHEGWQFRAVVRNNCGPAISPNFTVHVNVPVAEVPATGAPGAALAALALGLVSLGAGLGIARKRRG